MQAAAQKRRGNAEAFQMIPHKASRRKQTDSQKAGSFSEEKEGMPSFFAAAGMLSTKNRKETNR